jgi:rhodanese-related sulfurtransferase
MDQLEFYKAKLQYETDSWDLSESLNNGDDIIVIDARSPEHTILSISLLL